MRTASIFLLVIVPGFALGQEVLVRVQQRGDPIALEYVLHTDAGTSNPTKRQPGRPMPAISEYTIREDKLVRTSTGATIGAAVEVLAQARIDRSDVVLARQEWNSLSTPWRWLAAFSGHPVQVSRISWFLVRTDGTVSSGDLVTRPSAYEWSVELFEASSGSR